MLHLQKNTFELKRSLDFRTEYSLWFYFFPNRITYKIFLIYTCNSTIMDAENPSTSNQQKMMEKVEALKCDQSRVSISSFYRKKKRSGCAQDVQPAQREDTVVRIRALERHSCEDCIEIVSPFCCLS